jgi:hypothetical protein
MPGRSGWLRYAATSCSRSGRCHARIEQLERAIRETAEQGPWRDVVARLRCLRGIDTLSALGLVAR